MSAARPNCKVCIDPEILQINQKLMEGSGNWLVAKWIENRRRGRPDMPHYSPDQIRGHRQGCLGLEPMARGKPPSGGVMYQSPEPIEGVATTPPEKPREPVKTPDDPGERAKMIEQLLYSSLADLSAKDLYNLHMKELDLKIAQENRLAKQGAADPVEPVSHDDPGGFDEAMARAGGHRPELRIVKPKRAS